MCAVKVALNFLPIRKSSHWELFLFNCFSGFRARWAIVPYGADGDATARACLQNVYNIYDNCPRGRAFLKRSGLSKYDLNQALQHELNTGGVGANSALAYLQDKHQVQATSHQPLTL